MRIQTVLQLQQESLHPILHQPPTQYRNTAYRRPVSENIPSHHPLCLHEVSLRQQRSRTVRPRRTSRPERKLSSLAEIQRLKFKQYCPIRSSDRRSRRKRKSGLRSEYFISALIPCLFGTTPVQGKYREEITSRDNPPTIVSVRDDNENYIQKTRAHRGNFLKKTPSKLPSSFTSFEIVECSERTAEPVWKSKGAQLRFYSVCDTQGDSAESLSFPALSNSNSLVTKSLELEANAHFAKTEALLDRTSRLEDHKKTIKCLQRPTSKSIDHYKSCRSCFSNNNANAARASTLSLPRPSRNRRSRGPVQCQFVAVEEYEDFDSEKRFSKLPSGQSTRFYGHTYFEVDANQDCLPNYLPEPRAPSESRRIHSARAYKTREEFPANYASVRCKSNYREIQNQTSVPISKRLLPTRHFARCYYSDCNLNPHNRGFDCTTGKSPRSYIPQTDMGCIQSIAKTKVSPDRYRHHCFIVESIHASIDEVPTEIEEKSDIVLRYKTPYFRANAKVIVPPIPRKETWTIGWIQACDSMKFINEYGNKGSSSWEIPALKERRISAVSDSDGVSYPWYGNTTEIASIEGPTETSRCLNLRMNDNFHPSVTWDIPVNEGSEAHLTHIVRDQSFTTWLAAVNQTTGRLEVLRTVKWHFFLEIEVDPIARLGRRARVVSPSMQEQPIILKNNNDPIYLSHVSSSKTEVLNDRQHRRMRAGGDNNSNNHMNYIPKSALVRPSANNAQTLIWRPTRDAPVVVVAPKEVYRENNEVIWFSHTPIQGDRPNVKVLSHRETTQLSKSMDR